LHTSADHNSDNIASRRVIEANGGKLIERFHKPAAYGGAESLRFRISFRPMDVRYRTATSLDAACSHHNAQLIRDEGHRKLDDDAAACGTKCPSG